MTDYYDINRQIRASLKQTHASIQDSDEVGVANTSNTKKTRPINLRRPSPQSAEPRMAAGLRPGGDEIDQDEPVDEHS